MKRDERKIENIDLENEDNGISLIPSTLNKDKNNNLYNDEDDDEIYDGALDHIAMDPTLNEDLAPDTININLSSMTIIITKRDIIIKDEDVVMMMNEDYIHHEGGGGSDNVSKEHSDGEYWWCECYYEDTH